MRAAAAYLGCSECGGKGIVTNMTFDEPALGQLAVIASTQVFAAQARPSAAALFLLALVFDVESVANRSK